MLNGASACTGNEASLRAQERWLTRDLAAVNRTRTPWVLVNFHNPWYSTDYSFKVRRLSACISVYHGVCESGSCPLSSLSVRRMLAGV